ncbi:HemK2/MTQ2 family protein methyltransferase [Methanonatronarchaeum sp. AMET6-2]|uniref:HemK2/MTQ2 family protein methyltransferase n=1 Tax=Methanonatronarchaeum sp. AMET6-2 TaxID=2933293 RepID=UPI0011FE256C|nr:HemK2/MTQ2 family protein methyltransferase [Methanonatronarchaeum sp. AMET6-2]RZN63472.1 MAG: methyltransferase domain-containing protein [Methanonatronarchaeia archaeon]UOY09746.1 class I SAM-dependent methyltransferase [Methanonatronarchaeum sp. AMET6-2]
MNFKCRVDRHTYPPSDDSKLLAKALKDELKEGEKLLDMGTGSGVIASKALDKAGEITAVDINPHAIKSAEKNIGQNEKTRYIVSDLFKNVPPEKYDLITFNPPYLPTENEVPEKHKYIEKSWSGGKNGRETINNFITQLGEYLARDGRTLLLVSSVTDPDKVKKKARENGFKVKVIRTTKIFFEKLIVLKLEHK